MAERGRRKIVSNWRISCVIRCIIGAGSSASSLSGYRLSGTDMTSWIGRRVQIVGSVVPAAPGASPTAAAGATSASAFPEFRVISVQPTTGDCPQR